MKPTATLPLLCLALFLCPLAPANPAGPATPLKLPGPAAEKPVAELLQDAALLKWRKTVPAFRRLLLMDAPPAKAFHLAFERAHDEFWMTRLAALEFLSEKADPTPQLIDLLQTRLGDEAWMVRAQAAETIGVLRIDTPPIRATLAEITTQEGTNAVGQLATWALRQLDPPAPTTSAEPPAGTLPVDFPDPRFAVFRTESTDLRLAGEMLSFLEPATRKIARELGTGAAWTDSVPVVFYSDPDADRLQLPAHLARHLPATNRVNGLWLDNEQTLLMTADWGAGILVHELVHARLFFDMLRDPRAGGYNRLPVWAGEGLAAAYEGNIRHETNSNGRALTLLDSRHESLAAALRRQDNPGTDPADGLQDRVPTPIPPLTLDWLFGLGDQEFIHYYQHVCGGPSIALAREWILYLREKNAVAPWLAALRAGSLSKRTSVARIWAAKELAWKCALAVLPGLTRNEIEADFRAWILARNIADGDALAHIERTLHLETFQLAPSAAGAGNPVPAPELP